MKLGDMTFKQIAEICKSRQCYQCPFYSGEEFSRCCLTYYDPAHQNLNMEVNTDAEN